MHFVYRERLFLLNLVRKMYKWIFDELLAIERDRTRIDNRVWLLMQKVRHLDEKLEEDGIDRGEMIDD